ncbi:MAG TPA: CoB--CoM heterodisulfide reductase iron-sulfur subunit B family protein [Ignavibacteria bacterium]|nr:CoB--CoM heterodisulfide reductase iron-sulfur subunit B family protein [Ignavibacteria bacterium]
MKYSYYPGCSLHSAHKGYDQSCKAVFKLLDYELEELKDWNCCGATIYMSIKEITALASAAANLALAEKLNKDLVTPCSSCYTILNKAHRYLKNDSELMEKVNLCLSEGGLRYNGNVRVRHPLDVLINDIGIEIIKLYVKKPLYGLRIANYYGCQLIRPERAFDDKENPQSMENLFESIGAEDVYFPNKLKCCGGMLMTTFEEAALKLTAEILQSAEENDADCIATTCPLCQMNLEAYQKKINKIFGTTFNMPILFFTQILGIAFGLPGKSLGMEKNFYECKKLKEIELSKPFVQLAQEVI